MRSLLVVVGHELTQDSHQMLFVQHNEVVKTLSAERPNHSLDDRVHLRRQLPAVAVIRNDSV